MSQSPLNVDRITELEDEVRRLETLVPYADHKPGCHMKNGIPKVCNCGFTAAVRAAFPFVKIEEKRMTQ